MLWTWSCKEDVSLCWKGWKLIIIGTIKKLLLVADTCGECWDFECDVIGWRIAFFSSQQAKFFFNFLIGRRESLYPLVHVSWLHAWVLLWRRFLLCLLIFLFKVAHGSIYLRFEQTILFLGGLWRSIWLSLGRCSWR